MMNIFSRLFGSLPERTNPPTPEELETDLAVDTLVEALGRAYDPDKILADAGLDRSELSKLLSDDEIAGALDTRRDAVMITPYRLEPAGDTPLHAFIKSELDAFAPAIIRAAWNAVPYGYSVAEAVYLRRPDGKIGLARFQEKPMKWFEPKADGRLIYYPAHGAQTEVEQTYKFFLTRRDPTYANPYGEALLSRLYWPFIFRHNGWRFWMQYLDQFGSPLLLCKSHNVKELLSRFSQLGISNVIAVPHNDEVTAVTNSAGGEFERVEQMLAKRIQKLVLGQTLTTDTTGTGSYALGEVHNAVRMDKRSADLRIAQATLQRVVNALVFLNFRGATPPRVRLADDAGIEPARAERDAKLVTAGAVKLTKAYLLRAYDYNEGDIELADQEAPGAGAPTPEGEDKAPEDETALSAIRRALDAPAGNLFAARKFTRAQEEIEALADLAKLEAGEPIDPAVIRAAALAARSPADLEERLAVLVGGRSNPVFELAMAQASFFANVLGYVAAEKQSGAKGVTAPRKPRRT